MLQSPFPFIFSTLKLEDEEVPDIPFEETPKYGTKESDDSVRFSAWFGGPEKK